MSLQVFWFCLVAVLWSGYFVLEGFDFGVGMLLPFTPRDERERSVLFESIGPFWDGNEVWLVVAAGATFAAFPAWYATMFSGFYLALLVLLVFLIIRVVSFEWRTKHEEDRWRKTWLAANFTGSIAVPLIWGIALANLVNGVPLNSKGEYAGRLSDLFSAYTVFAGVALVLLCAFHGATFLTLRTTGDLHARVMRTARLLSVPVALAVGAFVIWTIAVAVNHNDKNVFPSVVPAVAACCGLALAVLFVFLRRTGWAFAMTAVGTVLVIATVFTSLYPRVLVSAPTFANSLTVPNSASAHYTLVVIAVVAVAVTPIVLLYQGWSYYIFRARLTGDKRGGYVR